MEDLAERSDATNGPSKRTTKLSPSTLGLHVSSPFPTRESTQIGNSGSYPAGPPLRILPLARK